MSEKTNTRSVRSITGWCHTTHYYFVLRKRHSDWRMTITAHWLSSRWNRGSGVLFGEGCRDNACRCAAPKDGEMKFQRNYWAWELWASEDTNCFIRQENILNREERQGLRENVKKSERYKRNGSYLWHYLQHREACPAKCLHDHSFQLSSYSAGWPVSPLSCPLPGCSLSWGTRLCVRLRSFNHLQAV